MVTNLERMISFPHPYIGVRNPKLPWGLWGDFYKPPHRPPHRFTLPGKAAKNHQALIRKYHILNTSFS
ncbi:11905_t:CDS:2 [Funneliformis mosseae]|uniref:11905_t:CDS:1 n=1 Tax=Funneliformis mosseae TaxID=27381 RepID=A0A9N8YP99_FUNMO|nr:11905_t:CDS:2 [Funneliformis mosseae]